MKADWQVLTNGTMYRVQDVANGVWYAETDGCALWPVSVVREYRSVEQARWARDGLNYSEWKVVE